MTRERRRIVFPREVLLVEIERHCLDPRCGARTRIGLTKEEARLYDGFECERCERRNDDGLSERDIPDWWEELTVTGLDTLRARQQRADDAADAGGVVSRLSDAWRRGARGGRDEPGGGDETA